MTEYLAELPESDCSDDAYDLSPDDDIDDELLDLSGRHRKLMPEETIPRMPSMYQQIVIASQAGRATLREGM